MSRGNRLRSSLWIGLAGIALALIAFGARRSRDRPEAAPASPQSETAAGLPDARQPSPSLPTDMQRVREFLALLLALSWPFWLFGRRKLPLPVNLPMSALMGFMPMVAAAALSYRHAGYPGVRELFRKVMDYAKAENKVWFVPALLTFPLIYLLSYLVMRLMGRPLPAVRMQYLMAPVFFVLYFIEGIGEELGWMGYVNDPLQRRWHALGAGLILGGVSALWHIIGLVQTGNPAQWIVGQTAYGMAVRLLTVWIYNNTGKSVLATILFHTMSNLSWSLFPNYGSGYDPVVTALITWVVAGAATVIGGPRTLAGRVPRGSSRLGEKQG